MNEKHKNMAVHFSSASNEWGTPQSLFDALDFHFHFTLDPCASASNAKCKKFFTLADDGLKQSWAGETVFMNPPYGRKIGHWIKKAYEEGLKGASVVCLIPSRTDTAYFHDYCIKGAVLYLRGRVSFVQDGKSAPAPFPSCLVGFAPGPITLSHVTLDLQQFGDKYNEQQKNKKRKKTL